MALARTIQNLEKEGKCTYLDEINWEFYLGGGGFKEVPHTAKIEVRQIDEDKVATIMLTVSVDDEKLKIRMAPYEFKEFNEMCKRASFKVK